MRIIYILIFLVWKKISPKHETKFGISANQVLVFLHNSNHYVLCCQQSDADDFWYFYYVDEKKTF